MFNQFPRERLRRNQLNFFLMFTRLPSFVLLVLEAIRQTIELNSRLLSRFFVHYRISVNINDTFLSIVFKCSIQCTSTIVIRCGVNYISLRVAYIQYFTVKGESKCSLLVSIPTPGHLTVCVTS